MPTLVINAVALSWMVFPLAGVCGEDTNTMIANEEKEDEIYIFAEN
jgi:hypothetical protein